MKRLIIGVFIFAVWGNLFSQEIPNLSLIENTALNTRSEKVDHHISVPQFLDNCIYEHKCGSFLSDAFKEFGFVKGAFLSIDRRLRCNGLTRSQTFPIRFNKNGLIKDHPKDYRFEVLD